MALVRSILRMSVIPLVLLLLGASILVTGDRLYRPEVPPAREYETSKGSIIITPTLKFQLADSLAALANSDEPSEPPPRLEAFLTEAAGALGRERLSSVRAALNELTGSPGGFRQVMVAAPDTNGFRELKAYLETILDPEAVRAIEDYWNGFFKSYYAKIFLEVEDRVREDAVYFDGLSPVRLTEELTGFENRQEIRAYPSYFAESVWIESSPGAAVIVYPHSGGREALFPAVVESVSRPPLSRLIRNDPVVSGYVEELKLNPTSPGATPAQGRLWMDWMEDRVVDAVVQAVAAKSGRAPAGKARGLLDDQIQMAVFDYLVNKSEGESDLAAWLREHISEAVEGRG